jgi:phage terminase large subunit-like protein
MVTATAQRIPEKWLKLFELIPGYDPVAGADAYEFDDVCAEEKIAFFAECLRHAKSTATVPAGSPFVLEPWQQAVTGCLFGWKHRDTRLRRYRECFLYVPKKTGKTAWAAGMLICMQVTDREFGAELFSAASSKEQASLVFGHVVGMIRQEPTLSDRLRVYGERGGSITRSVVYDDEMSCYQTLAADAGTVDGVNVHFAVIDEVHRHKTPELAEVLQKSTAARPQPLVLYTTTADYKRPSLCNDLLKYAKSVRDNGGDPEKPGWDLAFLPVIYEATKEDDYTSRDVWYRANPNLGVTVSEEFFAREVRKAADSPTTLNNFLRLHLNIVTDADVAFFDMAQWDACAGDVDVEELAGKECYAGLDLATTKDVAALVLLFPEHGNAVYPVFWVPRETARKREKQDRVPYVTWAREGFIELTEGNVVNYDAIHERIKQLGKIYNIREIAIDRWNSTQLQTQLVGDGFEVVKFGQGYASMTAPTKELEKLVIAGNLRHGGNPVLRWMAGNTMVLTDPAGNIKPAKDKSAEKIDGIVSLVMALARAMVYQDKKSVYSKRGVRTF